ncbi:hypothetical protein MTP99_012437 [Tenebrio molitor]|jgi:hypothetical protein|nr:hypothetical protein MTP99_012437 [Tenebrio molitor]
MVCNSRQLQRRLSKSEESVKLASEHEPIIPYVKIVRLDVASFSALGGSQQSERSWESHRAQPVARVYCLDESGAKSGQLRDKLKHPCTYGAIETSTNIGI